ncbi:MAG: DNA mismatch repair endonuclease MutL [Bacteroidetes bacterium]|nr:DNA mismatch repair endonuclease MutL [Bacteroidota bacterium]
MSDIIHRLPESVANQIAAGEVIQRPASALKELLENAVDAGASDIRVIIKDAGKTLIQVTDNGCGMTESDAMNCFERHATSKIRESRDLFAIRTLGFRGEALASIAAIAQVELKTRLTGEEMGTCVNIEGSKIIRQAPCQCSEGTSIAVKNLFFNVPARRNFLKSNTAEIRHLMDEFQRVALVNPQIAMHLFHNNKPLFQLSPANRKERIIAILGSQYKERLLPVEQVTQEVSIQGYIGKPEFAKKTRGDQFFFTNGRFIRHPYLHHAVESAMSDVLPRDTFPTYFLYIDIDPSMIDVNIHPTKTEVNFQDNQLIYAVLRSAVKQTLGKFSITPTLDFEVEQSFDIGKTREGQPIVNPFERKPSDYNPFSTPSHSSASHTGRTDSRGWEKIYEGIRSFPEDTAPKELSGSQEEEEEANTDSESQRFIAQFRGRYIVTHVKSGLVLINQQKAHQRVLYEKFLKRLEGNSEASQQELFPQNVSFNSNDSELIQELTPYLRKAGFNINQLGRNTFIINGTPSGSEKQDMQSILEGILETYKNNMNDPGLDQRMNLARAMAMRLSMKPGKFLEKQEMENLINELFSCNVTGIAPDGEKILVLLSMSDLEKMFK